MRTDALAEELPFDTSGESLLGQRMSTLQTRYGQLNSTLRPAAFEGRCDELIERSILRSVGGIEVQVAALEDVIRCTEAAARDKDIRALPELYRLAGLDRQPSSQRGEAPRPASATKPHSRRTHRGGQASARSAAGWPAPGR